MSDPVAPSSSNVRAISNGGTPADNAKVQPAMRPEEQRSARLAQSFANIVAVLMRDTGFKNLKLADLEWLVLPPVMSGQWRLAHSKADQLPGQPAPDKASQGSMLVPVAVALWASVSAEIDKRLSESLDKPLQLRPQEWSTGEHLWLVAIAGDRRALPAFLKQLAISDFKGKTVKMRVNGPDGKVVIKTLEQSEQPPPAKNT